MVSFSPSEVAEYYRVRLPQLNQRGPEWRGPCPIHRGTRDSFAVHPKTGLWNCHSACGRGGDIIELEMALTSADFKTARVEAYRIVGQPEASNGNRRIVATYDYRNEGGDLLYQAVRTDPKGFRQRQPDGKGGWLWNVKGVRLVLYRLPELLQRTAETVFVCEGEKDVHALESLGLLATCNPMGAGKWRSEYSEMLQGRKVVILPDNDEPGRRHAAAVADGLLRVGCQVSIIELPRGKDASDWIDVGGTRDELRSLFREHSAAPLTVGSLAEWRTRWGLDISKTESADETNLKSGEHNPGSLVTKCLADIEAKPVSWLWSGRIARGKVTILAGNPGLGKSQITASIAAVVTAGGQWPVTREQYEPGGILFLTAEDDAADTLRPRLEAAGADLRRIHFVEAVVAGYTGDGSRQHRTFSLEKDLRALEAELTRLGNVAAVVIDPITAYLGDTDSHRNAEVRGLLAPLSETAARHNVAIIAVSHLNKVGGAQALMRVTGSLAFVAASRAAYLVTLDPADKERRLFLSMKNNLGKDIGGLAFRIEGATVSSPAGPLATSRIAWESDAVTMTADEAMEAENTQKGTSVLNEAADWLREILADGPMSASELLERASAEGFREKTVRRAAKELGIKPAKDGMEGGWRWSLPPKMAKSSEDGQQNNLATFGKVGHLPDPQEAEIEL